MYVLAKYFDEFLPSHVVSLTSSSLLEEMCQHWHQNSSISISIPASTFFLSSSLLLPLLWTQPATQTSSSVDKCNSTLQDLGWRAPQIDLHTRKRDRIDLPQPCHTLRIHVRLRDELWHADEKASQMLSTVYVAWTLACQDFCLVICIWVVRHGLY